MNSVLYDKVRHFTDTIEHLVPAAKEPGFSRERWAPLTELVATDRFERVGIWREVMDWEAYLDFLTGFAAAKGFESTVRRVTECSNIVFYEIEERHIKDGRVNVVNSMNAFEFDDEGLICRLDVYIQGVVEPSVPVQDLAQPG